MNKTVVIGLLGTTLDTGQGPKRWDRWRPTVALTQHEDLVVDRLELLHNRASRSLAAIVKEDIAHGSPETEVRLHEMEFKDAWEFEGVYATLHDFARSYRFDQEREDYLVHITTGTHVAQICLFLLTESRHLPAKLLQTSPGRERGDARAGTYAVIDLDLSRYDRLASRKRKEDAVGQALLKSGIKTKNRAFNEVIDQIFHVASTSRAPLLLTGPTGAGKSRLARRIFELKKQRRQVEGDLAEVNCATLRGDAAMSALFGHRRGAFTGAVEARAGLLVKAHKGVLFLDEIGELGRDEQAMLLRAIEERVFYPMGSDREVESDFQLVCGTNRDLSKDVTAGRFREDLLARIDIWTFRLPPLADRPEDLEPNIEYELERASDELGIAVTINREARSDLMEFARGWPWPGNFRELSACVTRMATLAKGGRITPEVVALETARMRDARAPGVALLEKGEDMVARVLGAPRAAHLDRFDRVQLADVLSVCRAARSLSAAGRELFASSRAEKQSVNDADRLRKYLGRFGIELDDIRRA